MAIRGFMTNNLVADYDMYKEFGKHRLEEIKKDNIGYTPVLFYKPGLMYGKHTKGNARNQRMYVAICKCACMTIAYNVWYDIAKDYVISKGATSYKEFVDIPMTAVKKFKSKAEKAIKDAVCDLNGRTKAYRGTKFDACRYLAMYWTYLDCIKDTSTQRYFPTQLTILRAAKVFGYEEHENPFIMNGKYIHHDKNEEETVKTTGREINSIPEEKVGEIIDEFMKDELDPKTISVEDMDFSMIKTYHCLQRKNIRTLDQLLRMSPSEIIKIRGIGRRSYEEIRSKVEEYGYIYPNMSTPAIVVMDDGKEYINRKIEIKKIVPEDTPEQVKEHIADTSTVNLYDQFVQTDAVLDNLKAPNAIAKKIYDLEEENAAIRSKYEKLDSMYLKCASEFENIKKENEELEQTNKRLSNDKLKDMEAYEKLKDRFERLHSEYNKSLQLRSSSQPTRHDVSTMIKEVIDAMCRDKIEEIGIIVDGFVVQIHPRKDERKLGTYTIRTRESIV